MADKKKKKTIWDFLSAVGMGLSGYSAPFLGDYDWLSRQQRLWQEEESSKAEQAFQEWQKQLEERKLSLESLDQRRQLRADLQNLLDALYEKYRKKGGLEEALKEIEEEKDLWRDEFSLLLGEEDFDNKLKQLISNYWRRQTVPKKGGGFKKLLADLGVVTGATLPFPAAKGLTSTAKIGAQAGQVLREQAKQGMVGGVPIEEAAKLPSRAIGVGGELFNLLQGTATGLTGYPFKTIPQHYLNLMHSGELFNVPYAYEFYKRKFLEWLNRRRGNLIPAGR